MIWVLLPRKIWGFKYLEIGYLPHRIFKIKIPRRGIPQQGVNH